MNNEIISDEQLIRLAYSKNLKIHLVLKDGTWRNGFVVSVLNDYFLFKDRENHLESFFFIQIGNVEPFIEEMKGGIENGKNKKSD